MNQDSLSTESLINPKSSKMDLSMEAKMDMGYKVIVVILMLCLLYVVYMLSCTMSSLLESKEGLLSNYDTKLHHAMHKDTVGQQQYAETSAADYMSPVEGMDNYMSAEDEMLLNSGSNPHGQYNTSNQSLADNLYNGN